MSDADLRAEIDGGGFKTTRGAFMVNFGIDGCAAYGMQLFLCLKGVRSRESGLDEPLGRCRSAGGSLGDEDECELYVPEIIVSITLNWSRSGYAHSKTLCALPSPVLRPRSLHHGGGLRASARRAAVCAETHWTQCVGGD